MLLYGVALTFLGRFGIYLALPGLLAIPVDLVEGVIQILALSDTADLVDLKTYVTPMKMGLFFLGLFITLAGWLKWLVLQIKGGVTESQK